MSSLWALSYLTEGDAYQIEIVLQYDITKRILELLNYDNPQIQAPALRTVGNLLTGYDHHTQVNFKKINLNLRNCWTKEF